MRRDRKRNRAAAVLAAVMGISIAAVPAGGSFAAFGAARSPVTEYDAETLARFADDTLEYWEIPGLIEQYNITFRNELESFYYNPDSGLGLTRDQLLNLAEELREEAKELDYEAEDLEDEITKEQYGEYQNNIRALKKYAADLEAAAEGRSAGASSAIRGLRITREKQTQSASEKMRNYQKAADQAEIGKKNLEIAQLTYDAAKKQQELGIYSAEQVLGAEEALNAAKAQAAAADMAMKSGKQDLLTMLGWSYDAKPEIMPVPGPDSAWISTRDLAADTEKAKENNHTLSDTRRTGSISSGGAVEKARTIKDQETKITQNMELLYKDMEQKRASYEAAAADLAVAEANKAAADRKYSVGMLSRQQYLTEEVAYLTVLAAKDAAGLDLTASMETYEWAVKGHLELGM